MNQLALGFPNWQRVPESSAWFTAVVCSDVGKFGDHLKQQLSHNLFWNALSCSVFLSCIRLLNTAPSFMEGPKTCNSCKIEYLKLRKCCVKETHTFLRRGNKRFQVLPGSLHFSWQPYRFRWKFQYAPKELWGGRPAGGNLSSVNPVDPSVV